MHANRIKEPRPDFRVTARGISPVVPWPLDASPDAPILAWAAEFERRYGLRARHTTPTGIVLLRQFGTAGPVRATTYHTELRLTPRFELTAAVHRQENSYLVRRLLTRGERLEPEPPSRAAATVARQLKESTVEAVAARRAPREPRPGIRFTPVPQHVRVPVPRPSRTGSFPAPGNGPTPFTPPVVAAPPPVPLGRQWPESPSVDVDRLAERVLRAIDHRAIARRERQGKA